MASFGPSDQISLIASVVRGIRGYLLSMNYAAPPICETYGLMEIPQTPNPIRIAFTRIADLAREIRIGCYGVDEHVNGEVTGKDGVTVVVAASNC